jgi:hypothetical protein
MHTGQIILLTKLLTETDLHFYDFEGGCSDGALAFSSIRFALSALSASKRSRRRLLKRFIEIPGDEFTTAKREMF